MQPCPLGTLSPIRHGGLSGSVLNTRSGMAALVAIEGWLLPNLRQPLAGRGHPGVPQSCPDFTGIIGHLPTCSRRLK